jgi:hypothetical protein
MRQEIEATTHGDVQDRINHNFEDVYGSIGDSSSDIELTPNDSETLPNSAVTSKATPKRLFGQITRMLRALTGKSRWWELPAISAEGTVTALAGKATTAQGEKADSAVQPGVLDTRLADYMTAQDTNTALSGKATTAQGVKADSAVQPSELDDYQQKLIPGANIVIAGDGKTISSTGGGGGASSLPIVPGTDLTVTARCTTGLIG